MTIYETVFIEVTLILIDLTLHKNSMSPIVKVFNKSSHHSYQARITERSGRPKPPKTFIEYEINR